MKITEIKELDDDHNVAAQELRDTFADMPLEEVQKYARMAKQAHVDARSHLQKLTMQIPPKAMANHKQIKQYATLIENLYKREMTLLFEIVREKKREG